MKIQNSSIFMASTHHETSFTYKESMTMQAAKSKDAVGAILSLSQEAGGKSVKEAMVDYQKQEKEAAKQKQKENENRSLQEMAERIRSGGTISMPLEEYQAHRDFYEGFRAHHCEFFVDEKMARVFVRPIFSKEKGLTAAKARQ